MLYRFKDEELQVIYSKLLKDSPIELSSATDYQQEIAVLMAKVNQLLTQEAENITLHDLNIWRATLETIKMKAVLIKEQRLEAERKQKQLERERKLTSIPLDAYKESLEKITSLLTQHLTLEQLTVFLPQLSQITNEIQNNNAQ